MLKYVTFCLSYITLRHCYMKMNLIGRLMYAKTGEYAKSGKTNITSHGVQSLCCVHLWQTDYQVSHPCTAMSCKRNSHWWEYEKIILRLGQNVLYYIWVRMLCNIISMAYYIFDMLFSKFSACFIELYNMLFITLYKVL